MEIDSTFARTIGLEESQKVDVFLHIDPTSAHTIHIEPLTPGDWEIIELHASFLEDNLLLQIRALPNPSFSPFPSEQARKLHPLTLHLSPTSTANIVVSSLVPPQSTSTPFVKVAPGAEVIVAPKTRPKLSNNGQSSNRSTTSAGRRSTGNRSSSDHHKQRPLHDERQPLFLRAVDYTHASQWFDEGHTKDISDQRLQVWIDDEARRASNLGTVETVLVSYVRLQGLEGTLSPQEEQSKKEILAMAGGRPALSVIAKISTWKNAPDASHAALSPALSSALGIGGVVGGLVQLGPAPAKMIEWPRNLKIYPFASQSTAAAKGFRFGGQTQADRENAAALLRQTFDLEEGLFRSPLTDGMIVSGPFNEPNLYNWQGGVLRFEFSPTKAIEQKKPTVVWADLAGSIPSIEVQPEIPNLLPYFRPMSLQDFGVPEQKTKVVSTDELMRHTYAGLLSGSSTLLTGGLGSGKTSIARTLGHKLQLSELFHVSFLSCRDSFSEETRISTIREKLDRLFAGASWATRPTGQSLIILDDLDKICPAETELQTQDNGRSRQITEMLLSLTKQYCDYGSNLVLLATVQSKETLHNLIMSGNIIKDIKLIKAPTKDQRRMFLEAFTTGVQSDTTVNDGNAEPSSPSQEPDPSDWLSTSPGLSPHSSSGQPSDFALSPSLSLLTIASSTDGYFPSDLALLLSRAKSECLIRSPNDPHPTLTQADFLSALKDFTPASLRSVTLHTSAASFSSIGGLHHPRRILLETLQYPTKYAPLFAQCPLRLRSGILLYGYPGCGKTLLASAVATECGLNFISVKGPEILNKYIGASEKSVRDLFDRAQAAKPCVLFFDEFDSIAPKRGHDSTGVTDRVVNQLLTQMDGAEGLEGVYVLAATSRPDLIDPALLRPGRLDKSVICGMPSRHERRDILEKVAEKLKLAADVEEDDILDEVASRTEGYSGADLQAVMYNAHLEAVHEFLDRDDEAARASEKRTMNGKGKHTAIDATADDDDDGNHATDDNDNDDNDILCFTLGDADPIAHPSNPPTAASRAALRAEFAAMDAATASASISVSSSSPISKPRPHHQHHHSSSSSSPSSSPSPSPTPHSPSTKQPPSNTTDTTKNKEPTLHTHHILSSLRTTRASISAEERTRLRTIYDDFQSSRRDGEMRDGSGGTEVGGRVTLM